MCGKPKDSFARVVNMNTQIERDIKNAKCFVAGLSVDVAVSVAVAVVSVVSVAVFVIIVVIAVTLFTTHNNNNCNNSINNNWFAPFSAHSGRQRIRSPVSGDHRFAR